MASESWEKRLCNIIRRYKPSTDSVSFRNEYSELVSQATARGNLSKFDSDLLLEARSFLESWAAPNHLESASLKSQWQQLFKSEKSTLPAPILESFIRRFPKLEPGVMDWEPILLSSPNACLVEAALDRRFVTEHDLNSLADKEPSRFYASVVLDVLVHRRTLKNLRRIWNECIRGTPRPLGLLSREALLVSCLALSPDQSANDLLLSYVIDSPQQSGRVLQLLIEEPLVALRFCRYAAFGDLTVAMCDNSYVLARVQEALADWARYCAAYLEKGNNPHAATASIIVSLIRASSLASGENEAETDRTLRDELGRLSQQRALAVLKTARRSQPSATGNLPVLLTEQELHQTTNEYLRSLPVGSRTGQESPERALRYERFIATKEVVEQVLFALDNDLDTHALRAAINAALFNCGVSLFATAGDNVAYNPALHETDAPGVVPNDPVVVSQPGRCLGELSDGFIILKAQVRPIPDPAPASKPGDTSCEMPR